MRRKVTKVHLGCSALVLVAATPVETSHAAACCSLCALLPSFRLAHTGAHWHADVFARPVVGVFVFFHLCAGGVVNARGGGVVVEPRRRVCAASSQLLCRRSAQRGNALPVPLCVARVRVSSVASLFSCSSHPCAHFFIVDCLARLAHTDLVAHLGRPTTRRLRVRACTRPCRSLRLRATSLWGDSVRRR